MIDLHCHSTVSDGRLNPDEVVRLAHQNGCTMLALTDHDHTGGLAQARAEAAKLGLRFISGVEISVTWRGRTIHVVGLDFDEHNEPLQNLLAEVRKGRLKRLEAIAAKLESKGIAGAYEGALALAANKEMASRTHLAEFLIGGGHVRNKQQAFTKYLGDGKSCAVPHRWTTLADCVNAVNGAGGLAVIAHPMRYGFSATAKRNLFEEFKSLGGAGIEVHSGSCQPNDRRNYAQLAERYGLLASAGSDFHRPNDFSGGILGACPELPENCRPVWEYFKAV
ncbi:Histidinol phosphatase and related hydrolases of the PHP family [Kingella potus]|uniref:Histidinol phosphatase and related hydrolases of the PHP family n=1 Tax=Kingella potus TaxID=265175 RepID=A0A377R0E8_9NEIS|nr:PHP domain-containing protein [Kingella potus]STR00475.1 Histidinol phosphatase and related hydrolases of the PHP family [Kingella potus]